MRTLGSRRLHRAAFLALFVSCVGCASPRPEPADSEPSADTAPDATFHQETGAKPPFEATASEEPYEAAGGETVVQAEAGEEPADVAGGDEVTEPIAYAFEVPEPEFPWPPPRASAMAGVPDSFFRETNQDARLLGDVESKLGSALDAAGYSERSYYSVPEGFALVTRLESINADGTPRSGDDRWAAEPGPLRSFSLADYLRDLFTSNPGFFRIIVLVVTSQPFSQTDESVDREEAVDWLHRGSNALPHEIAARAFTDRHSCTALIYEFEKIVGEQTATTLVPGRLAGRAHLERSGLWGGLRP